MSAPDPDRTVDYVAAKPPQPETADVSQPEQSTESIGPYVPAPLAGAPVLPGYRITAEIARGGMGRIYAAIDETLDREVAIKTLLPGADAERFVTEAKITAKLPHPAIPPVHALGTLSAGTPWLAMKRIHGQTLANLLESRDRQGADLPRFIQIFEQIAQAVGFAHSRGIIHRDLKPLNVMVGEFGEVQVMDWGLAKDTTSRDRQGAEELASDDVHHTIAGTIMGTPGYMAPEQARGEVVDQRADVFALGSILATILTGQPAFVGKGKLETIQKAANAELSEIFSRLDACGADAELIALCKRCLSANREDRPANGLIVANEIAAYRAGVEARLRQAEADRARAETQAAEQAKRRRVVQWAGGLIAAVLLLGLGVSLWQMLRAIEAEKQAVANERKAEAERDAKAQALKAEQKARAAEKQARDQAMAALRIMTDEIVENQLARAPTLTEENKDFLRKVIQHYEGFAGITADDAESRAIRAEGHFRVAKMRELLGDLEGAEASYANAITIYKQLAAEFPTHPDFRWHLAQCRHDTGVFLYHLGRLDEAEVAYGDALAIYKELRMEYPARVEFRSELAGAYTNLGNLLRATGRLKEAETAYNEAVVVSKALAAEFPTRAEFRRNLGFSHINLGNLLSANGQLQAAETAYRKAIGIYDGLVTKFPMRPTFLQELGISYNNLGILLASTGRLKEADGAYTRALEIRKRLASNFPTRPDFRHDLATAHLSRGNLLLATGQLREAEDAYINALNLGKQLVTDHPKVVEFRSFLGTCHNNFGALLVHASRLREAQAAYYAAFEIRKELAIELPNDPNVHHELATTLLNLAVLSNHRREFHVAEQHLVEAEPHHQTALKASPRKPEYRQFYRSHLEILAQAHAGSLKQAEAVRTAERIRDLGWDPPGNAYDAARALTMCIPIVRKEETLDAEKKQAAIQFYSDEAMKLLRDAVSKGFNDAAKLRTDPNLAPLRQREDFQKLLAELEEQPETTGPDRRPGPRPDAGPVPCRLAGAEAGLQAERDILGQCQFPHNLRKDHPPGGGGAVAEVVAFPEGLGGERLGPGLPTSHGNEVAGQYPARGPQALRGPDGRSLQASLGMEAGGGSFRPGC